jgi:hypothetical protein
MDVLDSMHLAAVGWLTLNETTYIRLITMTSLLEGSTVKIGYRISGDISALTYSTAQGAAAYDHIVPPLYSTS